MHKSGSQQLSRFPIYATVSNIMGTTAGELSGHSLPNILKLLAPHIVQKEKATVREQRDFRQGDMAGLEIIADMPGEVPKTQHAKLFARQDAAGTIRVYVIGTVSRSNNETNPAIGKFFDSFRLTNTPR